MATHPRNNNTNNTTRTNTNNKPHEKRSPLRLVPLLHQTIGRVWGI